MSSLLESDDNLYTSFDEDAAARVDGDVTTHGGDASVASSSGCMACSAAIIPLYISHGFSAWGDRMWQFALGLMISEVWLGTLVPISIYSFAIYIVAFLLVPLVGAWIDRADRLTVMFIAIVVGAYVRVVLSLLSRCLWRAASVVWARA